MKGKLIMTVEQAADRVAWERVRRSGIGGSDIAAIMGLCPSSWNKSAFTLYAEKHGDVEPEDKSDNEAVYWGTVHEDTVAREFAKRSGKKVRKCGTLQDESYEFMLANVDRLVVGEEAGLECKTANGFKAADWEGDNLPDAYYCQCQWYMMVTGFPKWYIACLVGGNHFVWKEIPRNDEFIADMRAQAIVFWHNLQNDIPPEVDGSEGTAKVIEKMVESMVGSDEVALGTQAAPFIARYHELAKTEKLVKEQKQQCQNALMLMMHGAKCGTYNNYKVINAPVKGREGIDRKKLMKEQPEIYERYKTVGKDSFRFSIKEVKE